MLLVCIDNCDVLEDIVFLLLTVLSTVSVNLDDVLLYVKDDEERMLTDAKRPRWFAEPLHVFTTNCQGNGSLSPTRVGKQCFSPSLQQPIKNSAFTPSPSPSPTRKTTCAR